MFNRLMFRILNYPTMGLLRIINMVNIDSYRKWSYYFLQKCGVKMNGQPLYISSDVYFDDFSKIYLSQGVVISKRCVFLTHDYSINIGLIQRLRGKM